MHSQPTFGRAVLGGIAGTAAMTIMMYGVAPMMGVRMDIAAMLGSMLGGSRAAGMMMHAMNGAVIFPAIYTYALYDRLPGEPVVKGIAWGLALWLIAQITVMPLMGAGVFSSAAGGMMAAMGSLVGHVLYGGLLGAVSSAAEPRLVHA
jgi:hypothetical protein